MVFALSSLSSRRPLFFFFLPGAAGDPSGPGLAFRFPGPSPPRVGLDRKKMTPPSFARVDPGREKRPFRCSVAGRAEDPNTPNGGSSIEPGRVLSGERTAGNGESPPAAFTGCHFRLSPRTATGGLVMWSQCPSSKFFSSSSSVRVGGCWVSAIQRRFKTEGVDPTTHTTGHLDNFWNLEVTGQNRSPDTRKPRGLPRALPHFSKSTQPPTV